MLFAAIEDQLHAALNAQPAAVEAQIVILRQAPDLIGDVPMGRNDSLSYGVFYKDSFKNPVLKKLLSLIRID